jgi:hypothetical protein
MPVAKNARGEYLPEEKPHETRFRQEQPSACTSGFFTAILVRRNGQFVPKNKRAKWAHVFRPKSEGGQGLKVPKPPSYHTGPWANTIHVVVCTDAKSGELIIQSVREPKQKKKGTK